MVHFCFLLCMVCKLSTIIQAFSQEITHKNAIRSIPYSKFGIDDMVQLVDFSANDDDLDKRGPGNLWFGPRLGKRDFQNNDVIFNPDTTHNKDSVLNAEDTGSSYFIIVPASTYSRGKLSKGALPMTPRLGRSTNKLKQKNQISVTDQYIPRLGRSPVAKLDDSNLKNMYVPRLGRSSLPFVPRLGRSGLENCDE